MAVLNYRNIDDRHLILVGKTPEMGKTIEVLVARDVHEEQTLTKEFKEYKIDDPENKYVSSLTRSDIVLVKFSHCFVNNSLIIFWPQ